MNIAEGCPGRQCRQQQNPRRQKKKEDKADKTSGAERPQSSKAEDATRAKAYEEAAKAYAEADNNCADMLSGM